MSTNRLSHDVNNTQVKQQRNCVDFNGNKKLNLHYKAMSHDDKCFIDIQTRQSTGPGNYQTASYFDCECEMPTTVNNATDLPMVYFKNGHDVGSCVVDDSSKLRVGLTKKFPRCPQQLYERPYKTVPYMGRGPGNMVLESQLVPGEATAESRPCNTLSGITIPHQYTPLINFLAENVQNEQHIVQEAVEDSWVRGGNPSRLVVRDIDYLERCGYQYMDKETNSEFWENKHGLL